MNEPVAHGGPSSRPAPDIPWAIWLLVAGAAVQLAIRVAPDAYSVFGPYLLVTYDMVVDWVRGVSPFLLAVAVVLAANRWPAGRPWLQAGAAALGVAGVLGIAEDIWFALWQAGPSELTDATQSLLVGRAAAAALAVAAAYALLARGLWQGSARGPRGTLRVGLSLLIGVAGLVATAVALWTVTRIFEYPGPIDQLPFAVIIGGLTAAGFAALAALAIAGVRVARRPDLLAGTLIATGAVVTLAASAWSWSFPNITPLQDVPPEAFVFVFTLPHSAVAAGMLAMIAGFAAAAVAARRGAEHDPIH